MAQLKETGAGQAKGQKINADASAGEGDHLLALAGLDLRFTAADGAYLHWQDEFGNQKRALDLGGTGGSVLGHNHPEMVTAALRHVHERRPMVIPGARGGQAEGLERMLADRLRRETGREHDLRVYAAASDALEAALAHARQEYLRRQRDARARLMAKLRELETRLAREKCVPTSPFFRQWERALGARLIEDFPSLERAFLAKNAPALEHVGHLLAVNGGVYGRSDPRSASSTGDRGVPSPAGPMIARVAHSSIDLEITAQQANETLYEPEFGPPFVSCRPFSTVVAIVVQPISRAAMVEIGEDLVSGLQSFRAKHLEIPIAIDETDCGLGRTGRYFEGIAKGIPFDYLVLGNALGGGMAKLSALAIDRERRLGEASPIGDGSDDPDDFSSAMGMTCLATLERDRVVERCARTGLALHDELVKIARCWPAQIAEVRGRGMMLAIEFQKQSNNPSAVVRALDQEQLLAAAIAGFLLRRREIRILVADAPGRILRIEPSAYLDATEVERVALAFGEVAALLEVGDAFSLLAHLAHRRTGERPVGSQRNEQTRGKSRIYSARRSSVELIDHLIENEPVVAWDPSLARFRSDELAAFLDRLSGLISVEMPETSVVRSSWSVSAGVSFLASASTRRDKGP
jgi:acetylornithine/succinyldiaminopimelate/putrescine aminotransferase